MQYNILNRQTHNFSIPKLAGGYSTDKQLATGSICLNMPNTSLTYANNGASYVGLTSVSDFYSFQAEVSANIGISGGFLLNLLDDLDLGIDINLLIDFLLATDGDIYSQNYYFKQSMQFPTQVFTPSDYGIGALNGIGLLAYSSGPEMFNLVCGSQFVQQTNYGAGLYVTYQLDFVTWDAKVQFNADLEAALLLGFYSFIDITAINVIINAGASTQGLEGIATLLVYQLGGNPTDLAKIFNNNGLAGFYTMACAFSNLAPCELAINQTLSYSMNDFPYQINMTANGQYVGNVATTGYTYFPYTIIGINATQSALTTDIVNIRNNMGNMLDTLNTQNVFVTHLLKSSYAQYLSSEVISNLKGTQSNIIDNIQLITNNQTGLITCYTDLANCTSNAQKVVSHLRAVDSNFIESFATAIDLKYAYCGNLNLGDISGVAIPLGNNNYIKTQGSGTKEMLQISFDDTTMTLIEPSIGGGVKIGLTADETGIYQGSASFNGGCAIEAIGTLVDNPI